MAALVGIRRGIAMLVSASVLALAFTGVADAAPARTVTISGKAFIFNFMDTPIPGATIKVREYPKLSAVTDTQGDYTLKVPNDANVTPYIEPGGPADLPRYTKAGSPNGTLADTHWNTIDLQTFHTRGQAIENANFQTPRDAEFNGLKAILSVPTTPDGRPAQCAIVTTASARNVRGVDYLTYWNNTPHGVPGASSTEYPAIDGPTYFNQFVIPDKTETATSEDGGIVWAVVPTGTYRIVTTSPTTRFASFLATCEPGRVINANPPWGAYQLTGSEKPLGASDVAGNVVSIKATRKSRDKRFGTVVIDAGENLKATVTIRAGATGFTKNFNLKPGTRKLNVNDDFRHKWTKATVIVKLKDAAGVSFTTKKKISLPKPTRRTQADSSERSVSSELLTPGVLKVGSDIPYPPFEFGRPPRYDGFDMQLVRAIAKKMDLRVKVQDTSFDTIFTDLARGKFDLVASATTITPERKHVVRFTDPLYDALQSLLVRSGSSIKSVEDLRGLKVAAQDGTSGYDFARDRTKAKKVVGFPNGPAAIRAVRDGKVDATIVDQPVATYARRHGVTGFRVVRNYSIGERYGYAVGKTSPKLLKAVNRGLAEVKADGTFRRIYKRWFGIEPPASLEG